MASNQRLRKARRKVAALTTSAARFSKDKRKVEHIQARLADLLPKLGTWEYMKKRVKEARIRRRRALCGLQ